MDPCGGSGTYNGWSVENNGLFEKVSELWGTTFGSTTDGYIAVATGDLVNPDFNNHYRLAALRNDFNYSESETMDFADMQWHMYPEHSYSNQGHALIRATSSVPEPGTNVLLGLGVLGMLWIRQRNRRHQKSLLTNNSSCTPTHSFPPPSPKVSSTEVV
ncbi:MAG: PEP-CTERM sorting domain-containing protein [Bacteroidetes bacterium]|nr:PEP-CTERM sorting domain-containing protein [Bacteroidota bacterium]